jgi:hypothetical protein
MLLIGWFNVDEKHAWDVAVFPGCVNSINHDDHCIDG